jgi:hypothetical protein
MLRDDPNISNAFARKGFDPPICNCAKKYQQSFKDQYVVHPHVMLNACLTLNWPDKSFQSQSQVAQLRLDTPFCLSAHPSW